MTDTREVTVHCDACDVDVTIQVPVGHPDEKVRWEHACSNSSVFRGEWTNPDVEPSVADPGPDDDVIWDGARQAYVPRVPQAVGESGTSAEAATP